MDRYIVIKGAKTHNLKNIDVTIPRGKITALVGISGAGKNSLAFDTIYAEAYLRYIESISPYIRQFLDKIDKPAVESMEGLPPAISFKHRKASRNPRSIVATSLDIYDYLKLLYSKIATFYCPSCGKEVKKYTIDEIIDELLQLGQYEKKIYVCFSYCGDIPFLINRGYYFYMSEGVRHRIDASLKDKAIDVLIDSIELEQENKSRLFEALDKSISSGKGNALIYNGGIRKIFSSEFFCETCNLTYPAADEHLFSFDSPKGACPYCKGLGSTSGIDKSLVFDNSLSLEQGGARPFNSPGTVRFRKKLFDFAENKGINTEIPIGDLDKKEIDLLLNGDKSFRGILGFFNSLNKKRYKVHVRVFISRYTSYTDCPECRGSRLNSLARSFKINGMSIPDFLSLTIREAHALIKSLDPGMYKKNVSEQVIADIRSRLEFLEDTGLHYIRLNRPSHTLSRGEFQRINLAYILGSTLSDSLLILDQPSSDLHPVDYEKLTSFLDRLKENENTILMIEHNPEPVRHSDYVIELGPLPGDKGGELIFAGDKTAFFSVSREQAGAKAIASANPNSTMSQVYFTQSIALEPGKKKGFKEWLTLENACSHNLKNITVQIPCNAFTVITGVSGAGKTTLLYDEMALEGRKKWIGTAESPIRDIVFIDPGLQRIRSNTIVAGFFDAFEAIRDLFASLKESKLQQYTSSHFSFNSASGQCEHCKGKGYTPVEMQFLPAVNLGCNFCGGTGYKSDILKIKYKKWNIRELLDLSIDGFLEIADNDLNTRIRELLENVSECGLGYLRLGQPLTTLSTGELQRIKTLRYMNRKKTETLFLIDEPAFGMHPHDIETVKQSIAGLLENKNTVVAAEHNIHLVAFADYIIELGPKGGDEGGFLITAGSPSEIMTVPGCITGDYLKKNLKRT